jgi:hypothetical protein
MKEKGGYPLFCRQNMAKRGSKTEQTPRTLEQILAAPRRIDLPDTKKIVQGTQLALEGRKMSEREMQGKQLIRREIDHTGTVQFLFFSDWHLGHTSSNEKMIKEAVDYILANDNVFCFFTGDPLEGINPNYVSSVMMQTPIPLTEQVYYLRVKYLEDLVKANKVLAMVTDYAGHTGWSAGQSTLRLYHFITAGYNIPLVQNGGSVEIVFPDGKKRIKLFHTPPPGSTAMNPTGGTLQDARREKSNRPNVVANGHIHKGAHSVEVHTNGDETLAIAEGTAKDDSDAFRIEKNPAGHYHGTGGAITTRQRTNGKRDLVGSYGYVEANLINQGAQILDYGEKYQLTEEWKERIRSKSQRPKPLISFDRKRSILEDDAVLLESGDYTAEQIVEHGHPPKPADQYRHMTYRVETPDPFLLAFGGHTLLGGSSAETDRFKKMRYDFYKAVYNNPHAALLILRGSFEANTASRSDRRAIVEKFATELQVLGDEERILGLMLGGDDFRPEAWKKGVSKDDSLAFMPGTELATKLHTRLYNNLSTIEFRMGTQNQRLQNYLVLAADKLGRSGSTIHTFNGLRRLDMQTDVEADIIVGGHMPRAGISTNIDPYSNRAKVHSVAPGWFAKFTGLGKGNRQDASPGGQSVIMLPPLPEVGVNHKIALPQTNIETATEHHLMLYLLYGLINTKDESGESMYSQIFARKPAKATR